MATTRPEFEVVFRDIIVPELIDEVKKTGISENAVEWVTKVWRHCFAILFGFGLQLHSALFYHHSMGTLSFLELHQLLTRCTL